MIYSPNHYPAPVRSSRLRTSAPLLRRLACLLLLGLAACTPTRSTEPQHHLLLALADQPVTRLETTIGVGPVRVAPFLEGTPIVMHEGSGALKQSSRHRWSEPLDQGIQRVMVQNLATLTEAKLRNFPWRQRATPQLAIRLDILDLDLRADGTAVLDVIWHLENLPEERLSRSRRERLTMPVSGGFEALPAAYSQLLLKLAERLVVSLQAELQSASAAAP